MKIKHFTTLPGLAQKHLEAYNLSPQENTLSIAADANQLVRNDGMTLAAIRVGHPILSFKNHVRKCY